MSEGASIGWMSVWLVCTIGSMILMIKFLKHAKKVDPEGYERMIRRSARGSRWVMKTTFGDPFKDSRGGHR